MQNNQEAITQDKIKSIIMKLLQDSLKKHIYDHLMITCFDLDWEDDQLPDTIFPITLPSCFRTPDFLKNDFIHNPTLELMCYLVSGKLINIACHNKELRLTYSWTVTPR